MRFENILCIILITLNTIECFVIYHLAYPKECALRTRLARALWWNLLGVFTQEIFIDRFFFFLLAVYKQFHCLLFFSLRIQLFNHIVILCTLRASLLLISLWFWVSAVWLSVSKLWLDISRYTILCTLICDFGHKNRNSSRLKRLVIKFTHNALHQVVYTQKLQEKQRVFREENQIKHELPSSKNSQKSHRIKDFF